LSDITVPSWRPQPERGRSPFPWLAIAGGALAVAAIAGAVLWGFARSGPSVVPVVTADPRPIKVKPVEPGGLIVPNQDQKVLDGAKERRQAERQERAGGSQLGPAPERPQLDQYRQQLQPPEAPKLGSPPAPAPLAPPPGSALQGPSLPAPVPPGATAKPATPPAPAPAPIAATAAPKPVAGGRALAQLAAVDSEEAAKAEWARLARRVPELAAFKPGLQKVEREGQPTIWRVRATGLADLAAARSLCEIVKAKGVSCLPGGG